MNCLRGGSAGDHQEGFTLIELLVVIVILGILSALAVPIYLNQRTRAYDARAKADLRDLANSEESYLVSNRAYGTLAELQASEASITLSQGVMLSVMWYTRDGGYCLRAKHRDSPRSWYWDSAGGGMQPSGSAGCPVVTSGTPGDTLP